MEPLSSPGKSAAAIVDAMLAVVAHQGLDRATVREVAKAARVSIGTVQHYFPTKDNMLAAAFTEVVRRIRTRVEATLLTSNASNDAGENLTAVLHELLPLDERRATEVRVQVAFAARAATTPALADLQQAILAEVRQGLREAFALILGDGDHGDSSRHVANAALALVDGLAQQAISTTVPLTAADMTAALATLLDPLLRRTPPPELTLTNGAWLIAPPGGASRVRATGPLQPGRRGPATNSSST